MSLKRYHEKRDFKRTSEPFGKQKKKRSDLYIIQKHAASRLHYDFRLELDGVLKSWAVPKGPSLDPSVKRLAVHVEDHPVEYGSFQGIIPAGEYGGGTVMLWDQGRWEPVDADPETAYRKGDFKFRLLGKKLKGLWKLIRIKSDPKNWLLIKVADEYARSESRYDVTVAEPLSVTTKEDLDAIASRSKNVWGKQGLEKRKISRNPPKPQSKTITKKKELDLKAATKSAIPKAITPQLATLVSTPPKGDQWLHEIKLDGYRLICYYNKKNTKLLTRRHQDWTRKFPHLVQYLKKMNLPDAVLDGEIVAFDDKQKADFQLLQNSIHQQEDKDFIYYVFDLVYYEGLDLIKVPLITRKTLLQSFLAASTGMVRFSDHVIGNGPEVFKKACELGLEGIVSKEINCPYQQKRTHSWLKSKCTKRQEFVIGGYTNPSGARSHFGSLLVGIYEGKRFVYCGHVGTGFTAQSLKTVAQQLQKYASKTMPFAEKPPRSNQAHWVKPELVAEIEFSEWTRDGILRTPSFKGLRRDKPPKAIKREYPAGKSKRAGVGARTKK